jgi:hypothetical protein
MFYGRGHRRVSAEIGIIVFANNLPAVDADRRSADN